MQQKFVACSLLLDRDNVIAVSLWTYFKIVTESFGGCPGLVVCDYPGTLIQKFCIEL